MHTRYWQSVDHSKPSRNVALAALSREGVDAWLACYRQMLKRDGFPRSTRREKARNVLKAVRKLNPNL